MSKKEVIQYNILIAKFMGVSVNDQGVPFVDVEYEEGTVREYPYGDLLYHSSWDWLMPACKKFDCLFEGILFTSSMIEFNYVMFSDSLDDAVTTYDIESTYGQLIMGIEWYNSLTSNTDNK